MGEQGRVIKIENAALDRMDSSGLFGQLALEQGLSERKEWAVGGKSIAPRKYGMFKGPEMQKKKKKYLVSVGKSEETHGNKKQNDGRYV